jgi:hypothetical protein
MNEPPEWYKTIVAELADTEEEIEIDKTYYLKKISQKN